MPHIYCELCEQTLSCLNLVMILKTSSNYISLNVPPSGQLMEAHELVFVKSVCFPDLWLSEGFKWNSFLFWKSFWAHSLPLFHKCKRRAPLSLQSSLFYWKAKKPTSKWEIFFFLKYVMSPSYLYKSFVPF